MYVRAPVLPGSASILFDGANRLLRPWACNHCSHSFLVVLSFTALEPFVFVVTPFWWCELFLSLSGFFHSPTLLFGVVKCSWLLAFLFHTHSFSVMRKVSWLLSLDRDILHESKMAQPDLVLSLSISGTC